MNRAVTLLINKRRIALILIAALTLILGFAAINVRLNADFSTYLRKDDPLVQEFNRIGDEYGAKSMAFVLVETGGVFTEKNLKLIRQLSNAYEELEGVAYVTSLTNVLNFQKTEWGLEVGRLVPKGAIPDSKDELDKLKSYTLSKERYVKDLVSADGESTIIVLRLLNEFSEFDVASDIVRVTESLEPPDVEISYGGMPLLIYVATWHIIHNLAYLEPLMLFLMIGALFIGFRKVGGVALPMLVVGISIIWTVGIMMILDIPLNILTGITPIILVAMGSADGIHVMKRYYEKNGKLQNPVIAMRETFDELSVPILVTTVTTMIGFLSLAFSDFTIIKQFGIATSVGLLMALIVTFLLFPVLISFAKPQEGAEDSTSSAVAAQPTTPVSNFIHRWVEVIANRKGAVLVISGVLLVTFIAAIPLITKSVDWSLCVEKGSKPYRAEMAMRKTFGGTLPIQALVKGEMKDPQTLKAMRHLERYLESVGHIGEVTSIASLISEMNGELNGRYTIPESREGVANLWFLIENEATVAQLVREDGAEGLIQGKLDTWDTAAFAQAVEDIRTFIDSKPEELAVIDLGIISPEARRLLLEMRAARITRDVMLDLAAYGIMAEERTTSSIIKQTITEEKAPEEVYAQTTRALAVYLSSSDSEAGPLTKTDARKLAAKLVTALREDFDFDNETTKGVLRDLDVEFEEDKVELVRSLASIAHEAAGEARVTSAVRKLQLAIGLETGMATDAALGKIKGALWDMNEMYEVIPVEDMETLGIRPDDEGVRVFEVTFENTGLAAVLKQMEEALIPTQIVTLFVALLLVALSIGIIFRSPVIGAIGVAPISLTILANFALMGYLNIGLDAFTAMIACVAIGLGIDTDIHFLSAFKREYRKLGDAVEALKNTLSTTGVAILINTVTVGIGFIVLALGPCQHVRRFGGLVAFTVVVSALFTFTVLPALTLYAKSRFEDKGVAP